MRIQPHNSEHFLLIMYALIMKTIPIATSTKKARQKFESSAKGNHFSSGLIKIKNKLEMINHHSMRIQKILNRKTKHPMPMFFVELESKEKNKDMYNINRLLNHAVSLEEFYKKKEKYFKA